MATSLFTHETILCSESIFWLYCGFKVSCHNILGGGNCNPLQYSCLGNPSNRGDCRLQSTGSQRVGHDCTTEQTHTHTRPNILHFADCSCNLHCVFFSGIALLLEDKLYSRLLSIFIINNRTVILEAQQEQQWYLCACKKLTFQIPGSFFLKHWYHSRALFFLLWVRIIW